jgi:hypothetical protein
MERLPYIDEYAAAVAGPPERTWDAVTRVLRGELKGARGLTRILGAAPGERTGDWNGDLDGATLPGFAVVDARRPERLELRGRHRFARYSLVFLIDGDRVRAQTYATFPGVKGRVYRALVISSGAHRVVTQRILRRVAAAH